MVGPRNKHGAIYDFTQKLRKNPTQLVILGDGTQTKSYLYITDCIEAMLLGLEKTTEQVEIHNVGSEDQTDVKTIAEIVAEEMGLQNVEFKFTGGVDGGRGWKGDVKNMLLDTTELKSKGWKQSYDSAEAIRKTVKQCLS
jgi:UDP-glucose 4-epimerase